MIDIDLINRTNRIRDARFADILPALQAQLTDDFCPAWQIEPVTLHLVGKAETPDPSHWKVWLLNTSDIPGDLGFHEIQPGIPEAKIFVETDILSGSEISVTISHELCLAGDTTIPLLDGTTPTIEELATRQDFWVYSVDATGNVQPGHGHSARLTRKDAAVIQVRLDSGDEIRCTADHPIMMRDGTYRPAGDLNPGDSLMPLYRRHGLQSSSCALCSPTNHKVVEVTAADPADVYDLTVDGFHNFAVGAGVFVHNCEMICDPLTTRMGPVIDGRQYIVEVCDAVEADADGYQKPGLTRPVQVSNFVLPAYYRPGSAPWDFRKLLPGPCPARLPGGYSMFLIVATNLWGSEMSRYADGSLSPRSIRQNGRSWQRTQLPPPP